MVRGGTEMLEGRTPSIRRGTLVALILVALLGCTDPISGVKGVLASEHGVAAFRTITSEELLEMLKDKRFPLVNVHVPYEGEIEQTDAFIPFDQISGQLDQLPSDKSAAIVLYCKSGRMSEIAARDLAALGYSNVAHLKGGMIAWEASGHSLSRR